MAAAAVLLIALTFFAGMGVGADLSELVRIYRNTLTIQVNGTKVSADNFLYNDTTYVPLRAISEMLGKDVGWNAVTRVASIDEPSYQKEALSKLLPSAPGYRWIYNGFAEYDHTMTLDSITDEAARRTYQVTGMVGDPSGGESQADRTIALKYIIEKTSLIQEKQEQVMMDSKFNRMTLIKTPLEEGNYWIDRVTDKTGKTTELSAQIMKREILPNGVKQYTVRYNDNASAYYEQRVIREGVGVVSFEKLFEIGDEPFSAGYYLYGQENMIWMDLTLYFADQNAEKVMPETRNLPVYDSRTAWAALQALIDGPEEAGHYPTIPEGTVVLDLGIANGVCTVNFSREFIDNHWGGSAGEMMTLSSIANTLTEFPTIQKVMILVEGKAGETLGNILLDQPLERSPDMIGS
jgi:hypothetical protein